MISRYSGIFRAFTSKQDRTNHTRSWQILRILTFSLKLAKASMEITGRERSFMSPWMKYRNICSDLHFGIDCSPPVLALLWNSIFVPTNIGSVPRSTSNSRDCGGIAASEHSLKMPLIVRRSVETVTLAVFGVPPCNMIPRRPSHHHAPFPVVHP